MLALDLKVPDREISEIVARNCASFGRVTSVKVHRTPSEFALVEMTTRDQTYELAANYGGSVFGTCALIHLEQKSG